MTKQDLVKAIAAKTGETGAKSERFLDALSEVILESLAAGEEVTLPSVGKLAVKEKAARTGRNPQTGETIQIPARKAPAFTALKGLKDAVAK